jgi:acetyl-CoA carboxylase beta subunit
MQRRASLAGEIACAECAIEFLHVAAKVIQRCRMHDSRVFAHSHVDWTEDERTRDSFMTAVRPSDPLPWRSRRVSYERMHETNVYWEPYASGGMSALFKYT